MDVHPPEHGIHSWGDFWIHLGTITIGLLIAIGLEQSVVKMHDVHVRHELEADLRAEGARGVAIAKFDENCFDIDRPWILELRHNVDAMRESGGKVHLGYPVKPKHGTDTLPSDAVWMTAKDSGLLEKMQAAGGKK